MLTNTSAWALGPGLSLHNLSTNRGQRLDQIPKLIDCFHFIFVILRFLRHRITHAEIKLDNELQVEMGKITTGRERNFNLPCSPMSYRSWINVVGFIQSKPSNCSTIQDLSVDSHFTPHFPKLRQVFWLEVFWQKQPKAAENFFANFFPNFKICRHWAIW